MLELLEIRVRPVVVVVRKKNLVRGYKLPAVHPPSLTPKLNSCPFPSREREKKSPPPSSLLSLASRAEDVQRDVDTI